VDLKQKLTAAGVTDIFNMDKANFSAISDTKLAVENVIHIAKIKVDLFVFITDKINFRRKSLFFQLLSHLRYKAGRRERHSYCQNQGGLFVCMSS
jgi:hypothetical protein